MNISNLHYRLSGGGANALPTASWGGVMSSVSVDGLTFGTLSTVTGVTIDEIGSAQTGDGSFLFDTAVGLYFRTFGENYGAALNTPDGGFVDGQYTITGARGAQYGYTVVTIVKASLPATTVAEALTITVPSNNLFEDVDTAEAIAGSVIYRCVYVFNTDVTEDISLARVYIAAQLPGDDTIEIALGANGVGDGATTGLAETLVDENDSTDVLAGLTFTSPTTPETGLSVDGPISQDEGFAVWMRRTVPALSTSDVASDTFNLGVEFFSI
jgi:hypothetical protein